MGSTHKTIYMPDLQALRIPLPPLAVQERIVEATSSRLQVLDRASDALERQMLLLKERREALIYAAVSGDLEMPETVP